MGLSQEAQLGVWCGGLRSQEQASFKIGFGTDPRDLSRVELKECMSGTLELAKRRAGAVVCELMMA